MGNHISTFCILTTPDSQLQEATNVQDRKACILSVFWNKGRLIASVLFLHLNSILNWLGISLWKTSIPDMNRTCRAIIVSGSPLLWSVKNHLLHGLLLLLICDILNISTSLKQGGQLHQKADKRLWSSVCQRGLKALFDSILTLKKIKLQVFHAQLD